MVVTCFSSYYEKFADGKVICIDEEIPFEIPNTWEWCRLGNLVDFSKSNSVKADKIEASAWLLDLEDIEKDTGKLLQKKRMGNTTSISDKHHFYAGNVLYSKLRPYLNKVIIADEDGFCTSEILCFDFGHIYNEYAQLYLMSPFFVEYAMSDAYGVKMPRLGSKQGNNGLMPIPPLEEQKRIVRSVSFITPILEKYSRAQDSLDKLNKEIKLLLRKSILQEAIQGRLVQQDASEEPASTLLQRIKEEKLRLVKEGKLKKKDVVDSVIFKGDDNKYFEKKGKETREITDEIPFDIPNSWQWCRVKQILDIGSARRVHQKDWRSTGIPFYRAREIGKLAEYGNVNNELFIDYELYKEFSTSGVPMPGDLMVTAVGTLGKVYVVKDGDLFYYKDGSVLCINNRYNLNPLYLKYVIGSPMFINQFVGESQGTTVATLTMVRFNDYLMPIPPLREQERIVKAIDNIASIMSR